METAKTPFRFNVKHLALALIVLIVIVVAMQISGNNAACRAGLAADRYGGNPGQIPIPAHCLGVLYE